MYKIKILIIFLIPVNLYADSNGSDFSAMGSFLLFPLLFVLMYFLLIRPQTKKINEHKKLISELKIGDEVVTQGGFIGKIIKITEGFIILSLNVNIEVIIKKDSVIGALPKGSIKQIK